MSNKSGGTNDPASVWIINVVNSPNSSFGSSYVTQGNSSTQSLPSVKERDHKSPSNSRENRSDDSASPVRRIARWTRTACARFSAASIRDLIVEFAMRVISRGRR